MFLVIGCIFLVLGSIAIIFMREPAKMEENSSNIEKEAIGNRVLTDQSLVRKERKSPQSRDNGKNIKKVGN